MNPMQMLMMMVKNSKNPQQIVMNLLEQQSANNPIAKNLLELAKNNNGKGIENVVRNMAKEKGVDFDKEFGDFKKMFE